MKFKPGDKVKFLDQVGEGVVKAILPNGKLMIEDEVGFDYEVGTAEVLLSQGSSAEAKLYDAVPPTETSIFHKDVDEEKLETAQDKFADLYKEKAHIKDSEAMEVDLHIHELLDRTQGMSNGEMLEHQIRHFERMMSIAERKKVARVVFIHGIGEGVLRAEIRRLIEQFYPNCSYADGNYRTYGIGATQIKILYN